MDDQRLAQRLKSQRLQKGWSLDELAELSGVSRASLSRLENAEISPTAQVLGKLCAAYGLTMSHLMHMVETSDSKVLKAKDQPIWFDRTSGVKRRNVSPPAKDFVGEVVQIELHKATCVTYDKSPRQGLEQHFYILNGELTLTVDGKSHSLCAGDSLRLKLHGSSVFETPPHVGATYLIFII